MKLKYLLLFFFLVSTLNAQEKQCNTVRKDNWNFSICLDSIMNVDLSNHDKIIIKQKEKNNDLKISRKAILLREYNYKNKRANQIWEDHFQKFKNKNVSIIKDSTYFKNDNEYYIKHISLKSKDSLRIIISTAIAKYKTQYFSFETIGYNKNDSYNFLIKILDKTAFYGAPKLFDDNKLKQDFLNKIINTIKNKSLLNKLIPSTELFISIAPEKEKDDLNRNPESLQEIIKGWNDSAEVVFDKLSNFDKTQIIDSSFKLMDSKNNVDYYTCSIAFLCDNEKMYFNLLILHIKNQFYLSRIIQK